MYGPQAKNSKVNNIGKSYKKFLSRLVDGTCFCILTQVVPDAIVDFYKSLSSPLVFNT